VALLTIVILLWSFIELARTLPGPTALDTLDLQVSRWFQSRQTAAGLQAFTAVSWMGFEGLIALGIVVAILFAALRDWLRLIVWLAASVGAAALDHVLKLAFHRPRPSFASQDWRTWGFPSGHTMASLVVYGLLAYFVLERLRNPWARRAIVAVAGALVGAIGISRLYLGAHYISDVGAGFLAGGAWLTSCIVAYQLAQGRRRARND